VRFVRDYSESQQERAEWKSMSKSWLVAIAVAVFTGTLAANSISCVTAFADESQVAHATDNDHPSSETEHGADENSEKTEHESGDHAHGHHPTIPWELTKYADEEQKDLFAKLVGRVKKNPFNLIATIVFVLAILHTFVAAKFASWAHHLDEEHASRSKGIHIDLPEPDAYGHTHGHAGTPFSRLLHFFGEVEVIFGLWVIPLMAAIMLFAEKGVKDSIGYVATRNFTEPMFVVVIMAIAASKPVIILAEQVLAQVAKLGKGSPAAWWLSILTLGPVLGSFITEPAAMTISAVLLAKQIYRLKPSVAFAYATIGLLFVNVSVGGVLTNFAAPPVLMVASKWGLTISDMLFNYGWRAVIGIVISNLLYFAIFRSEFVRLAANMSNEPEATKRYRPIPAWVTGMHLFFMAWTVYFAHDPVLFIGGFLFFIGFMKLTFEHQQGLELRSPILVGFFLAGLIIHGGLQSWWIEPVLLSLGDIPLMIGATVLTSFNDNAAITYLASLVPGFTDSGKYAVLAGAVTGGGLTVIANAPNPAGQSILSKYFEGGVSPLWLAVGALGPTIILGLAFMLGR
jgi:Na+/H+ antiporter NhaD/arsenite permease-like protein